MYLGISWSYQSPCTVYLSVQHSQVFIYRINGCLKWSKVRLYDGHSCFNHCLLSLVSLCHYVSSCFLANLDGGLNQQCLQIFRQALKPALAAD